MYSWVPLLFTWNCHNIVLISYTSKQNKYYVLKKLKKKVPLQVCNYSRSWVRSEISALPNIKKVQFSSVTQLCLTLCDLMDCSTPGFPVHHKLTDHTQTHVHLVSDAIQPPYPLSAPSPSAFNLSQQQDLFQWISSSHQVAKVMELQLQHQSFQWMFRVDFL